MTNCHEAHHLISALIDGELDGELDEDLRQTLEAHLNACDDCRATEAAWRAQHLELAAAFTAPRAASQEMARRVAARAPIEIVGKAPRAEWPRMFAAAAAGFLLAVILFSPWKEDREIAAPASARLMLTLGDIELMPAGETTWRPAAPGDHVRPGSKLRTGRSGRAEFETVDGAQVRLNGETEVRLESEQFIEVASGQVWATAAATRPLAVSAEGAVVTSTGGIFDFRCPSNEAVLTVAKGKADVRAKARRETVEPGESVTIVDGAISDKQSVHNLALTTRWIHELLLLKGPHNAELEERVNLLLGELGETKMSLLSENEIRSLGDHCVLPLTRFVQSPQHAADVERRRAAARILSDLAPSWAVGELIRLLDDSDAIVRFHAARGLERLTGQTQGLTLDAWQTSEALACEPARLRWLAWWEENKHRYAQGP